MFITEVFCKAPLDRSSARLAADTNGRRHSGAETADVDGLGHLAAAGTAESECNPTVWPVLFDNFTLCFFLFHQPPNLKNQVLLRELRLDDNSLSSLQGLAACWLPLMQHLSVAQNRLIPQLLFIFNAATLSWILV